MLDDVDKAKRKERPTWILNELETTIGRVYRRFLNDGRTLTLSEKKAKKIETRHIRPSDPLHQMPQSVEVQTFGISEDYGTVTIRFDGSNAFGYLPSFINDRPAEIRIRMVRLGMEKFGETWLPFDRFGGNAKSSQKVGIKPKAKASASSETAANFATPRHWTFHKTSKFNYFRGEMSSTTSWTSSSRFRTTRAATTSLVGFGT